MQMQNSAMIRSDESSARRRRTSPGRAPRTRKGEPRGRSLASEVFGGRPQRFLRTSAGVLKTADYLDG